METNAKWIAEAVALNTDGASYLTDVIGMSSGSLTFRRDSEALDRVIAEATVFRDEIVSKAKEDGWAQQAALDKMDADSFLNTFGVASPQWTKWQHAVARTTLGKMIEAELKADEAAHARERDVMETTQTAAA